MWSKYDTIRRAFSLVDYDIRTRRVGRRKKYFTSFGSLPNSMLTSYELSDREYEVLVAKVS